MFSESGTAEALAYSTDSLAETPYIGLEAEMSVREPIVDEEPLTPGDLQTAHKY